MFLKWERGLQPNASVDLLLSMWPLLVVLSGMFLFCSQHIFLLFLPVVDSMDNSNYEAVVNLN